MYVLSEQKPGPSGGLLDFERLHKQGGVGETVITDK